MVPAQRAFFQLGRYLPGVSGFLISRMVKSSLSMMDEHVRNGTSPTPDINPAVFAIMAEDQREAVRTGGRGIASDMKSLWRHWRFQLQEIKPKVLLWHGEADNLAPTMLAHYIAGQIPTCEPSVYPGEGHTGPLTRHLDEIMARITSVGESGI